MPTSSKNDGGQQQYRGEFPNGLTPVALWLQWLVIAAKLR